MSSSQNELRLYTNWVYISLPNRLLLLFGLVTLRFRISIGKLLFSRLFSKQKMKHQILLISVVLHYCQELFLSAANAVHYKIFKIVLNAEQNVLCIRLARHECPLIIKEKRSDIVSAKLAWTCSITWNGEKYEWRKASRVLQWWSHNEAITIKHFLPAKPWFARVGVEQIFPSFRLLQ